jgi:hypothetical protein
VGVAAIGSQHSGWGSSGCLRRVPWSSALYYNETRRHRSLNKDPPTPRPAQRIGRIASHVLVDARTTNTSASQFSVHTPQVYAYRRCSGIITRLTATATTKLASSAIRPTYAVNDVSPIVKV